MSDYGRAPLRDDPRTLGTATTLKSSSKYLNHPRLRDWVASESLRKDGADYDVYPAVLDLHQICKELVDTDAVNATFREARRTDKALDRWFDRSYLADYSELSGLALLPLGTLGREFYDEFILRRGLTPDFLPDFTPAHEADYWLRRAQQTHDVHHIITECALDTAGEARILGVYIANWSTHLRPYLAGEVAVYNVIILNALLSRIGLHNVSSWSAYMAATSEGSAIGAAMTPIYMPDYELMWDMPLDRIRSEMNIV